MRTLFLLAWASASLGVAAEPGIPVGSKVPDFELTDQSGQTRTLKSLMGPKGIMLVFFRSADW
jgi:cytochrome oxidase Cu insertion factor (SCO1/SenC/PrrC family)